MPLKPFMKLSAVACFAVLIGACGTGEIASPSGPGGRDSDGDGVDDANDPNPNFANPEDKNNSGSANAPGRALNLSFTCNEDARAAKSLQRLTLVEYTNTLRDLIRASTSEATTTAVMQAIQPLIASYPSDATDKAKPFSTMDQSVSDAHASALLKIGSEVGKQLTSSQARLDEVLQCSGSKSASSSASCLDTFIARFGKRALRHDLNQAERDFYKTVYAANSTTVDAAGLADVIAVMLNAPTFFYRVELGKDAIAGKTGLFKLSDHELATRLAYQFWQSTPDDELLAAADRGELSNDAGYQKQLDRVLADPRAAAALERFTREWLTLDRIESLDKNAGAKSFIAFAGDDMPSASLKEEMIKEVTASMAYHAFVADDSISDWVESPYSFAQSAQLAGIYETPVWKGGSAEPPTFPAGQRAGLVTRAALLATRHGTNTTSPILKGVLVREQLLCDQLEPPPAAFGGLDKEANEKKTTRALVESLTENRMECASCHKEKINPIGYLTEGFDALGRMRKQQPLYDDNGNVVAQLALDTKSTPRIASETDPSVATGPQDLTNLIVRSGKVERCFAMQYVRYSKARAEDKQTDGCELETVRTALDGGASIKQALRRYAMLPQFRQRFVPAS